MQNKSSFFNQVFCVKKPLNVAKSLKWWQKISDTCINKKVISDSNYENKQRAELILLLNYYIIVLSTLSTNFLLQ